MSSSSSSSFLPIGFLPIGKQKVGSFERAFSSSTSVSAEQPSANCDEFGLPIDNPAPSGAPYQSASAKYLATKQKKAKLTEKLNQQLNQQDQPSTFDGNCQQQQQQQQQEEDLLFQQHLLERNERNAREALSAQTLPDFFLPSNDQVRSQGSSQFNALLGSGLSSTSTSSIVSSSTKKGKNSNKKKNASVSKKLQGNAKGGGKGKMGGRSKR